MSLQKHITITTLPYYARMMRLHSLTGSFLVVWPAFFSIAFATESDDLQLLFYILFACGAFLMRSAGCIINDIFDRNIDAQVERTKNRPLASGKITLYEAIILAGVLLGIASGILLLFNTLTILLGIIILVPIIIYPLMKRITYWPQLFLALVINWGALMAWTAIHNEITAEGILIYVACIFWTLGYDTIYSYQDHQDDIAIGVKSTGVKFGLHSKKYIALFYTAMFFALWFSGIIQDMGIIFYTLLLCSGAHLAWQVITLIPGNPKNCSIRFHANTYVGMIVFLSIIADKILF